MTSIADARRSAVLPVDRALVVLAASGIVAMEIVEVPLGYFQHDPAVQISFGVVLLLLLAGGIVSVRRPEQRGNGRLMLLAVIASVARSVAGDHPELGPLAMLQFTLQWTDSILIAHLLLRWPGRRLQTRPERWWVLIAWSVPIPLDLVGDLFYDPKTDHWTDPRWWPTLVDLLPVAHVLWTVEQWVWAALLVGFVVLIVLRIRRTTPVDRRGLIPVMIAVSLAVVTTSIEIGRQLGLWDAYFLLFSNISAGIIPISLLVSIGVRRLQRALAVEDLATRGQSADADQVRDALRRALGDRRLEVATYSKEAGAYVGPDGGPAPEVAPDRRALFVPASDGTPLARLAIDPRLEERTDLTGPVARAAAVAFETVRLRADLVARAADEQQVRAELETATAESAALSRLLPGGLPEKLRADPGALGRIDELEVTVLMSDVRGYSTLAERTAPQRLAQQLQEHRAAMNGAVLAQGGTIMQYVGDAVMAVFGAPFEQPDHAERAVRAAAAMHAAQEAVNARWRERGFEPFGLGIGLSTGPVATAVLGSADRYEYTIVGDTVNLAQRLESNARPAGTTIASAATIAQASSVHGYEPMAPMTVKGRVGETVAFRRAVGAAEMTEHIAGAATRR